MDPPPTAHLHWNLSHRKWSCAASCQGRQIIHHLKNAPFSPLLHFPPPLRSLLVFFSIWIVFVSGPPERNSDGDAALCYLRYLKISCVQTRVELLPLRSLRLLNSWNYSPAVFPEDLWYSCPKYHHNAFVEFPKWMKCGFIWTLLKSET